MFLPEAVRYCMQALKDAGYRVLDDEELTQS